MICAGIVISLLIAVVAAVLAIKEGNRQSLVETLNIVSDDETMAAVREAEAELSEGG